MSIENSLKYPLYSKCCIQFPSHILLFSIARRMYSLPFPVSYCESPATPLLPCCVRELFTILCCVLPVSIIFIPYAAHKAIYRCASEMAAAAAAKNKYLYADLENKSHVIWRCARWRASWCSFPSSIPLPSALPSSLPFLLVRHLSLLKFWSATSLYEIWLNANVSIYGLMPGTQLVRSITHKKWVRNCA